MENSSLQISCMCCGAGVATSNSLCEYCGNPIRITTLKSTVELSKPLLMKYAKSYESDQVDEKSKFSLGLIFLRLGQYEKAVNSFDEAIYDDPVNSEAYFYKAVASLSGKKPFLCSRSVIDDILSQIDSAREIESQPIFSYFSAIIKYDYFARKGFKTNPDYESELSDAFETGVALGDIDTLLTVIRVELPDEFIKA